MPLSQYQIVKMSMRDAMSGESSALADLERQHYIEQWPHAKPVPKEVTVLRIGRRYPSQAVVWICLERGGQRVGRAILRADVIRRNVGVLELFISREARGRGLGGNVLSKAFDAARRAGFVFLRVATASHIPGGASLIRRTAAARTHKYRMAEIVAYDGTVADANEPMCATPGISIELSQLKDLPLDRRMAVDALRLSLSGRSSVVRPAAVAHLDGRSVLRVQPHESGIETWVLCAIDARGQCIGVNGYAWDRYERHLLRHLGVAVHLSRRHMGVAAELIAARARVVSLKQCATIRYMRRVRCGPEEDREMSEPSDNVPAAWLWYQDEWSLPLPERR